MEEGYGGIHADGDGCNVPAAGEGEGFLPSVGVLAAMATITGAVVVGVARRR